MNSVTTSENMMGIPLVNTVLAAAGGIAAKKTLESVISKVRGGGMKQETKGVDMIGANNLVVDSEAIAAKRAADKKAAEGWIWGNPNLNLVAHNKVASLLTERPLDAAEFGFLCIEYDIPKPVSAWLALQEGISQVCHPLNEKRKMWCLTSRAEDGSYWGRVLKKAARPTLSADEARDAVREFILSEEGKKIAEWLREDLRRNGPINWTVFGKSHLLPPGVSVGQWLSEMDFVNPVRRGSGKDYCELKELSPDMRMVRTNLDILPRWMVKTPAPVSIPPRAKVMAKTSSNDVPAPVVARTFAKSEYKTHYAKKPFFIGEISWTETPSGLVKQCEVSNVWSVLDGQMISNIKSPYIKGQESLLEGELVVGCITAAEGHIFFGNLPSNAPVLVLKWALFKESVGEPSAEAYFTSHPSGGLETDLKTLLGNPTRPGHIVIASDNKYFKGFKSVGGGKVCYDAVAVYHGDFQQLAWENQLTEIRYKGKDFIILVPEKNNEYLSESKHAVLDCKGWTNLVPAMEYQKPETVMQKTPEVTLVQEPMHTAVEVSAETVMEETLPVKSEIQVDPRVCSHNEDEVHFLNSIIQDAERCGYKYRAQDIIRFHTSVKLGAFTLLGGAPGCGKSTLVGLYARALAGSKTAGFENGLLKIDVNPAWMEPNDILGYWNLKGEYAPASSRLVPYLRAADGADRVGLVCLEEMNLARVEHYFSDFLQLMSRPADDRWLEGVPAEPTGGSRDAARLRISEKLRFVGTNNFDETTHRFSARFYDRCNYIELQKPDLTSVFPEHVPSFEKGRYECPVDWLTYSKWRRDISIAEVEPGVIDKSKTLFDAMDPLGLAPSQRVRFAILEYIVNRPFYPGCGSDVSDRATCQMTALDEAIVQRILPRYTLNYLREESGARDKLLSLLQDFPLSHKFFEAKCFPGERPSRA